jgi:hypothetical protein
VRQRHRHPASHDWLFTRTKVKNDQKAEGYLETAIAPRGGNAPESKRSRQFRRKIYWLANSVGEPWKMPAPDTCEAIRKAATTAGTLISLRN